MRKLTLCGVALILAIALAGLAGMALLPERWSHALPTAHAQGPTGTVRVAPTGADTTGCGSVATPCRTIQHAVDEVIDGGQVLIAQGVYTGVHQHPAPGGYPGTPPGGQVSQVVTIDKYVTLRGGYATGDWVNSDPVNRPTVVDAQGQGRGIFIAGVDAPVIDGLRITGGDATGLGGGVWGDEDAGGGIYVSGAPATIQNCWIYSNTAQAGGGVMLESSDGELWSNWITGNSANSTPDGSFGDGGGAFLANSNATLTGNIVAGNTAGYSGSGLYFGFASDGTASNNMVVDNVVNGEMYPMGCGVYVSGSSPTLLHTTISGNRGGFEAEGSGLCVDPWPNPSSVALTNTIVVSQTTGIYVLLEGAEASLEATLWGSGAWANGADWTGPAGTVTTGTINIWGAPAFVNPAAGDYHIGENSAARDAGVNTGVATDIDGQARPQGTGYDIGADEWYPAASCPEDVTGDGTIDTADILAVALGWGGSDPTLDVSGDGQVDIVDILRVAGRWMIGCPSPDRTGFHRGQLAPSS